MPRDTPASALSSIELQSLCDAYIDLLGGDGRVYQCGEVRAEIDAERFECEASLGACQASVGDIEACARENAEALESCSDPGAIGPACERVMSLCSAREPQDDPVDDSRACIPGETTECACADGTSGAQVCMDDGSAFSPCECNPNPPTPIGSCIASFCPMVGEGTPCCAAANGPCGMDQGRGCEVLQQR